MITKQDLIKLGYNKKQDRILGKVISEDYRFGEPSERDYLVNLSEEGVVNIEFGIRKGQKSSKKKANIYDVQDLDEFLEWHDNYEV